MVVGGQLRGMRERVEEMIDLGLNFYVYVQNKPISKYIIFISKLKKPKLKTLKVNMRELKEMTHGFEGVKFISWALGMVVRTLTLWNWRSRIRSSVAPGRCEQWSSGVRVCVFFLFLFSVL